MGSNGVPRSQPSCCTVQCCTLVNVSHRTREGASEGSGPHKNPTKHKHTHLLLEHRNRCGRAHRAWEKAAGCCCQERESQELLWHGPAGQQSPGRCHHDQTLPVGKGAAPGMLQPALRLTRNSPAAVPQGCKTFGEAAGPVFPYKHGLWGTCCWEATTGAQLGQAGALLVGHCRWPLWDSSTVGNKRWGMKEEKSPGLQPRCAVGCSSTK